MRDSALNRTTSRRVLWFAFLATLIAGIATLPAHLAAQRPAAAAQSDPGTQANAAAKPDTAKSDSDQSDKFRHSPLVQSAARVLNLQVETTARIFEVINFAIIALAIGIPLVRFLPKYLRKRSETLRGNLESARKATEDANTRLSAIEAKYAGLGEQIAKFLVEVEQASIQDEARIKSAIEEERARIVQQAEQEIGAAAAQARRTLRSFAANLAIEQAAHGLVLSPETDRALIAEFVSDMAGNGARQAGLNRGGQN